ncbi:MAG: cupin domain-containing protein [Bacteroidales bacterium]|nr:cupin domain-containing protein [Bacteroidales bacterium]
MQEVIVERYDRERAEQKGIFEWPIWARKVSRFPWTYDSDEECWIIEGTVEIETSNEKYLIQAGDFVTFKNGLSCTWNILADIRKHYNFP